jgi:hypothetical protein
MLGALGAAPPLCATPIPGYAGAARIRQRITRIMTHQPAGAAPRATPMTAS